MHIKIPAMVSEIWYSLVLLLIIIKKWKIFGSENVENKHSFLMIILKLSPINASNDPNIIGPSCIIKRMINNKH